MIATLGLVALALLSGLVFKVFQGRGHQVRKTETIDLAKLKAHRGGVPVTEYGKKATLVQFSTEYCGQCPGVRRALSQLEYRLGGLSFVEVDITERLDLAAHFNINQTPTVFLLNQKGSLVYRVGGVPKMNQLTEELRKLDVK